MSPHRQHSRGPHPEDPELFAVEKIPALRCATEELSWLLTRNYAPRSALKLVGDRHALKARQRQALARAACSDQSLATRRAALIPPDELRDRHLVADGFNLLITAEVALARGVLLRCRDDCLRDLASVHGSYRNVAQSPPAMTMLFDTLAELAPASVLWLLDRPVSNSGRLAVRFRQEAESRKLPWEAKAVFHPDRALTASDRVVLSADGPVLDCTALWCNLTPHVIRLHVPNPWIVDLAKAPT
jgi:hypothetical protein